MTATTLLLAPLLAILVQGPMVPAGGEAFGPATVPVASDPAGHVASAADEKTLNLQVLAIRATTKNREISPELKDIADQLRKQFKFTGFKVEKRERAQCEVGKPVNIALISGFAATITPESVEDKRVRLKIVVKKDGDQKPRMDATVTIDTGKTQLSGGWELGDGDALILGVAAR